MKKIGLIGQGFIGKNYADDFENRGYEVVRYALEEPFVHNKDLIKECDFVFIAVPTPSTPEGFDFNIIINALKLVGKGKIAIIKSTILPGTTEKLQAMYPDIYVTHSPEFLTEATAAYDAANPNRNIVGVPFLNEEYTKIANDILSLLPNAPYQNVVHSKEAELIKYGGNIWFYFKVLFINMLYDMAEKHGADYSKIKEAMAADPRIGSTHLDPIHKTGRGAGGHCFIKDFAAFTEHYNNIVGDENGKNILESLKNKNTELMIKTRKDLDLLREVYGEEILEDLENLENIDAKIDEIDYNINKAKLNNANI